MDRLTAGESPTRVFRELRGLTPESLSARAAVAPASLAALENGRRNPSLDTLRRLASALEVDLDDLVD